MRNAAAPRFCPFAVPARQANAHYIRLPGLNSAEGRTHLPLQVACQPLWASRAIGRWAAAHPWAWAPGCCARIGGAAAGAAAFGGRGSRGEWGDGGAPASADAAGRRGGGGAGRGARMGAAARACTGTGRIRIAPFERPRRATGTRRGCEWRPSRGGTYGGGCGGGRSSSKMFQSGLRSIFAKACSGLIPLRLHVPLNDVDRDAATADSTHR